MRKSLNLFQIGWIVYRQFSMTFAFESTSGQWTRASEIWTSAHCDLQQHPFRHIVPFSLWTMITDTIRLFLRTRTNEWVTSVLFQTSLHKEKRDRHLTCILFHYLLIHKRCRWTLTWISFFLWNSLVSFLISTINCWIRHWDATYSICRSPSAHLLFCQSFCIPEMIWTSQSVFPCIVRLEVLVYLTKTQYRIRKDVDLCALKIDDSLFNSQRQVFPWMILPTNSFQSRDLILFKHQSCRYVEHLFQCVVFLYSRWNDNCSGNSFPWILLIPLSQTSTFPIW